MNSSRSVRIVAGCVLLAGLGAALGAQDAAPGQAAPVIAPRTDTVVPGRPALVMPTLPQLEALAAFNAAVQSCAQGPRSDQRYTDCGTTHA